MFENAVYLCIGIVVGVIHHAYLQPKITAIWKAIKAKASEISGA